MHPGVPNALSIFRILAAPVLIVLAWNEANLGFAIVYLLSLISDIADGQIARRFGLTSELGAKLDSWGDLLTYVAVLPGLWWLQPKFVSEATPFIVVVACSYVMPIFFGFAKYGKLTSYHTRMATVAAYGLGASLLLVFFSGLGGAFKLATVLVVVSQLEEIAITATLSQWHANVPSFRTALRLR